MRSALRSSDRLNLQADLHLVADEEPAGFERGIPVQPVILPIDRRLGFERDALVAPGVLRSTQKLHIEAHLARDAMNRQVAGEIELIRSFARD